jgi:hypothetical protein
MFRPTQRLLRRPELLGAATPHCLHVPTNPTAPSSPRTAWSGYAALPPCSDQPNGSFVAGVGRRLTDLRAEPPLSTRLQRTDRSVARCARGCGQLRGLCRGPVGGHPLGWRLALEAGGGVVTEAREGLSHVGGEPGPVRRLRRGSGGRRVRRTGGDAGTSVAAGATDRLAELADQRRGAARSTPVEVGGPVVLQLTVGTDQHLSVGEHPALPRRRAFGRVGLPGVAAVTGQERTFVRDYRSASALR